MQAACRLLLINEPLSLGLAAAAACRLLLLDICRVLRRHDDRLPLPDSGRRLCTLSGIHWPAAYKAVDFCSSEKPAGVRAFQGFGCCEGL
jgi:hypothetical protein